MKFILTLDTEADNQWAHGVDLSTRNLRFIPRLEEICDRFDVRPTYLVTSEVCGDEFAARLLSEYQSSGRAEVGAHLHVWTTPPFEDKPGFRFNDTLHGFANELPEPLLRNKIERLTQEIGSAFGQRPTSFRSGRYGFDDKCARILLDNGYTVDSSVTPYIDWSSAKGMPGGTGGPDFSRKSPRHSFISIGNKSLLEIPVTVLPTIFPLTANDLLARFYSSLGNTLSARMARKLTFGNQPVWLRPFRSTTLDAFRKVVEEAGKRNLEFITMMFHSSELMPGCSPYRKNQQEVEALFALLSEFFRMLRDQAIRSLTLSEAANAVRTMN